MLTVQILSLSQRIDIGGTVESVIKGGKHLYPDCAKAFEACGIKKVAHTAFMMPFRTVSDPTHSRRRPPLETPKCRRHGRNCLTPRPLPGAARSVSSAGVHKDLRKHAT